MISRARGDGLLEKFAATVGHQAHVQVVRGEFDRTVVLLSPHAASFGVPIYLHLAVDQAVVRTGIAGRLTLNWESVDDDQDVCDVVTAIIAGNAIEYCVVNDVGDLDGALEVWGDWGRHAPGPASDAHLQWRLPRWAVSLNHDA